MDGEQGKRQPKTTTTATRMVILQKLIPKGDSSEFALHVTKLNAYMYVGEPEPSVAGRRRRAFIEERL